MVEKEWTTYTTQLVIGLLHETVLTCGYHTHLKTRCDNNINVVLFSCQLFLDHNKIKRLFGNSDMGVIYEIHKYQQDDFQYVVASTNKYPEIKVKNDVERMNSMLNESLRTMGIKYVFVASDTSESTYKERKKKNSY